MLFLCMYSLRHRADVRLYLDVVLAGLLQLFEPVLSLTGVDR